MVKTVFLIVFLLFSLYGLCEFIHIVKMCLISPKIKQKKCILILLNRQQAVEELNYNYEKLRWNGESYASKIIAVTDKLEEKEKQICEAFANSCDIMLSSQNELSGILYDFFENGSQ